MRENYLRPQNSKYLVGKKEPKLLFSKYSEIQCEKKKKKKKTYNILGLIRRLYEC